MPLLVFQITAVLVLVLAAFFMFRGGGAKQQAIRRIFFLLFVALAAFSLFFPEAWTKVANFFGIGRGTDLLLYIVVLVFFGYAVSTFRKFRNQEKQITQLAREIALLRTEREQDNK
ncbi:MAG: DUF2304 domain-containing protein [Microbacteriaceae bacterium]|nr:DUF2304 domain-containing protein [Microbacteriaceae bacterium]